MKVTACYQAGQQSFYYIIDTDYTEIPVYKIGLLPFSGGIEDYYKSVINLDVLLCFKYIITVLNIIFDEFDLHEIGTVNLCSAMLKIEHYVLQKKAKKKYKAKDNVSLINHDINTIDYLSDHIMTVLNYNIEIMNKYSTHLIKCAEAIEKLGFNRFVIGYMNNKCYFDQF